MSDQLGELLHDTIRYEQTTDEALACWDAFAEAISDKLTSAHAYLAGARDHAFTCLDPDLRARLARLGRPELGTGVLERVMREINARTNIGARPLEHRRTTRSPHRAHRTATAPPNLEGDQTGHPQAQHYPIPPAKVQRLTTLPITLVPPAASNGHRNDSRYHSAELDFRSHRSHSKPTRPTDQQTRRGDQHTDG